MFEWYKHAHDSSAHWVQHFDWKNINLSFVCNWSLGYFSTQCNWKEWISGILI